MKVRSHHVYIGSIYPEETHLNYVPPTNLTRHSNSFNKQVSRTSTPSAQQDLIHPSVSSHFDSPLNLTQRHHNATTRLKFTTSTLFPFFFSKMSTQNQQRPVGLRAEDLAKLQRCTSAHTPPSLLHHQHLSPLSSSTSSHLFSPPPPLSTSNSSSTNPTNGHIPLAPDPRGRRPVVALPHHHHHPRRLHAVECCCCPRRRRHLRRRRRRRRRRKRRGSGGGRGRGRGLRVCAELIPLFRLRGDDAGIGVRVGTVRQEKRREERRREEAAAGFFLVLSESMLRAMYRLSSRLNRLFSGKGVKYEQRVNQ